MEHLSPATAEACNEAEEEILAAIMPDAALEAAADKGRGAVTVFPLCTGGKTVC
jgi:hypothetical protein